MKNGFRRLAWLWLTVTALIVAALAMFGNGDGAAWFGIAVFWLTFAAAPAATIFCFTGLKNNA